MRQSWVALALLVLGAAACGGGGDKAAPPPPRAKAEKPVHCFFKDEETKDWKLKAAGAGLAEVSGHAFRSDGRYKALLLEPKIEGRVAVLRPSIAINDTGYSAEGNWWDVKATVPTADIDAVEVRCGKKVLASLKVERPAG